MASIGLAPLLGPAPFELCDFELALFGFAFADFGFAALGFDCDLDFDDFDFAAELALFDADRFFVLVDFVLV